MNGHICSIMRPLLAGLLDSFAAVAKGHLAQGRHRLLQAPFHAQAAHDVAQACDVVQKVTQSLIHAAETMQAPDRGVQQAEAVSQCAQLMHMSILFMLQMTQQVPVASALMHDLQHLLSNQHTAQTVVLIGHQLQQDAEATVTCVQQSYSRATAL